MSVTTPLKSIVLPAISTSKHTATVIFVHGLGDTGHGWAPVAEMLRTDRALQHIKWILPHAPVRPVTANFGMQMPSWFDVFTFDFNAQEDEPGLLQSAKQLNEIITSEVDGGIDSSRIVIGGFSQGGAMSLLTSLTSERKLAGAVSLSGFLPIHKKIKSMLSPHANSLPIFWGHGSADPLVKLDLCKMSIEYLKTECGIKEHSEGETELPGVQCKVYEGMGHSSCPQELNDLKSWLKSVIPKL